MLQGAKNHCSTDHSSCTVLPRKHAFGARACRRHRSPPLHDLSHLSCSPHEDAMLATNIHTRSAMKHHVEHHTPPYTCCRALPTAAHYCGCAAAAPARCDSACCWSCGSASSSGSTCALYCCSSCSTMAPMAAFASSGTCGMAACCPNVATTWGTYGATWAACSPACAVEAEGHRWWWAKRRACRTRQHKWHRGTGAAGHVCSAAGRPITAQSSARGLCL